MACEYGLSFIIWIKQPVHSSTINVKMIKTQRTAIEKTSKTQWTVQMFCL